MSSGFGSGTQETRRITELERQLRLLQQTVAVLATGSAAFSIDAVATGAPGSSASVTLTEVSPSVYEFDFTIPAGDVGATGPTGPTGATGPTGPAGSVSALSGSVTLTTGAATSTVKTDVNVTAASKIFIVPSNANGWSIDGAISDITPASGQFTITHQASSLSRTYNYLVIN